MHDARGAPHRFACRLSKRPTGHNAVTAVRLNSLPSGSVSSARPCSIPPVRVAPRTMSRSISPSRSTSATVKSKRCRFPPVLRRQGRTAPADLGSAVRRLDRGLLILVPHQRPGQCLGPENPNLPGAVAGELAEEAAAGQVGIARFDHAELVAFGISEDDVFLFGELADVEVTGPEFQRRRDRVLLPGGAVAGEVEVHPVQPGLLGSARDEPQADLGVGPGQQQTAGVVKHLPSQDRGPEAGQASRVVRVEGQGLQLERHLRRLGVSEQSRSKGSTRPHGVAPAAPYEHSVGQPYWNPRRHHWHRDQYPDHWCRDQYADEGHRPAAQVLQSDQPAGGDGMVSPVSSAASGASNWSRQRLTSASVIRNVVCKGASSLSAGPIRTSYELLLPGDR